MRGEAVYTRIKHLFEGIRSERIRKAARKSDDLRSWTRKRIMPLHDILICILARKGLSAAMEIRKLFEAAGWNNGTGRQQARLSETTQEIKSGSIQTAQP